MPAKLVLQMHSVTQVSLQCMQAEFEAGRLAERLQGNHCAERHIGALRGAHVRVAAAPRARVVFAVYVHIPYQSECVSCV